MLGSLYGSIEIRSQNKANAERRASTAKTRSKWIPAFAGMTTIEGTERKASKRR